MAGFITERRYMRLSPLQRLRNETNYDEPKAKGVKPFWFYDAGEVEFFTKVREKSIGAKSK
jgi:hypothetical protein